jgi:hypothetical protein
LLSTYVLSGGGREEARVETTLSLGLAGSSKVGSHNGVVLGVVVELQDITDSGSDVVGSESKAALTDVNADSLCAGDSGESSNGKSREDHFGGCGFVCFV